MNLYKSPNVAGLEPMKTPRIKPKPQTRGSAEEARKAAEKELKELATGRGASDVIGVRRSCKPDKGVFTYTISGQPAKKAKKQVAKKPHFRNYKDQ